MSFESCFERIIGVTIFVQLGFFRLWTVSAESNEDIAGKVLEELFNKSNSIVRPGVYGDATEVEIDFFVQSFGPLNEVEMEFNVDLDFRETWVDHRLAFNTTEDRKDMPVYIPASHINKIWIPDVYFPNDKAGYLHKLTIPNKSIRVYSNGTVRYFTRMSLSISCTMYLKKFPLDEQLCYIKISTYSYDQHEIVLRWKDNASIEIKQDELNLPQFVMEEYSQGNCTEIYKTGEFSCLQANFTLYRQVGFFVLQTYIPSILIVMLSWVAFWINKNSEPARIALGVTTVLTMTTQLTTSRSNAMRVSYPKAMDVWYSFCMLFVFAALIEYAFVNVSVRMEKKHEDLGPDGQALLERSANNDVEKQGLSFESSSSEGRVARRIRGWRRKFNDWKTSWTSKGIDHISRRLFPAAYLVFNLIYWLVYANISSQ